MAWSSRSLVFSALHSVSCYYSANFLLFTDNYVSVGRTINCVRSFSRSLVWTALDRTFSSEYLNSRIIYIQTTMLDLISIFFYIDSNGSLPNPFYSCSFCIYKFYCLVIVVVSTCIFSSLFANVRQLFWLSSEETGGQFSFQMNVMKTYKISTIPSR